MFIVESTLHGYLRKRYHAVAKWRDKHTCDTWQYMNSLSRVVSTIRSEYVHIYGEIE